MPTNKHYELTWRIHPAGIGGERALIDFPNGYGASILRGGPFYTDGGTYEVAVFADGKLTYATPITDDVLGHLTESEMFATLAQIEALPARNS